MVDPKMALAALLKREGTPISWADLTFNPWIGCTKVGPACLYCYAETLATNRLGVQWGLGAERRRTVPGNWVKPLRWQKIAAAAGVILDVFCASLADWADKEVEDEWRLDLAAIIRVTPNLRWMLLTKRIPLVDGYLCAMFPEGVPENVALGITVVTQQEADRDIPRARFVKQKHDIPRLFLSMEPLLEEVHIDHHLFHECPNWEIDGQTPMMDPTTGAYECCSKCDFTGISDDLAVDLVITGGGSGNDKRLTHPAWFTRLQAACEGITAFHFKQWGEWKPYENEPGVAGCWLDPDGHVYQGPTQWPPAEDERRSYMIRVGAKKAGRLLGGVEYLARLPA